MTADDDRDDLEAAVRAHPMFGRIPAETIRASILLARARDVGRSNG